MTCYESDLPKSVDAGLRIAYLAAPDSLMAGKFSTALRATTIIGVADHTGIGHTLDQGWHCRSYAECCSKRNQCQIKNRFSCFARGMF